MSTTPGSGAVPVRRRRWRTWWWDVTTRRHAQYGAAVTRIGLGVVLAVVCASNLRDAGALIGPRATVDVRDQVRGSVVPVSWNVFTLSDSAGWFWSVLAVGALALGAMIVGWHTRVAVPVVVVLYHGVCAVAPLAINGGDHIALLTLTYLAFADTGAVWSLDARRRQRRPQQAGPPTDWQRSVTVLHNGAVLAVAVQLCIVYTASGMYKVQSPTWQDGTAVYWVLRADPYRSLPWLSDLVVSSGAVVLVATYVTALMQLTFPAALINPWTRRTWLVVLAGMHLSIGLLLGIPAFSAAVVLSEAVLIRDSGWRAAQGYAQRVLVAGRALPAREGRQDVDGRRAVGRGERRPPVAVDDTVHEQRTPR